MDWTTILNGLVWVMGLLGASFMAYGGWVCLRQLIGERAPPWCHETLEIDPVEEGRAIARSGYGVK